MVLFKHQNSSTKSNIFANFDTLFEKDKQIEELKSKANDLEQEINKSQKKLKEQNSKNEISIKKKQSKIDNLELQLSQFQD